MKNKFQGIIISFILLMTPTAALPFSVQRNMQYISVDSLSDIHIQSNIILKIKNDSILLEVNNKSMLFAPKYIADSITFVRNNIYPFLLASEDANTDIHLTIEKLLSIEKNSICVSARYQEFDSEKGWNLGKIKTIDSLYVGINDIQGVILPVMIRESSILRLPSSQWHLTGGYQFNAQKNKENNHVIEVGIAKDINGGGIEPAGLAYYFANEFLFNSDKFSIGPKIGGNIYFWGVVLGNEIVYYTDFHENTLHWVPFGGFGIGVGKIFFAGHIPFYNKKYSVNDFSVGLTIPICSTSKKKIKHISNLPTN